MRRPHGGVTLPLTGQHQRPVEAHDFRQTEHVARHRFQKVLSFFGEEHDGVIPYSRVLLTRRIWVPQEKIRVQICQQSQNAAAGHLLAD